jgi:tetratricopeptide (TPR) repeat protein
VGNFYNGLDRLEEAATTLYRGLELAERVGDIEEQCACLVNLGQTEMQRGNMEEAIACDRRAATELGRIGNGPGRLLCQANLVEKLILVSQLDEADALCERSLEFARAVGIDLAEGDLLYYSARIRLLQDQPERAALLAAEAAEAARRAGVASLVRDALELEASAWDAGGEPLRAEKARQASV